MRICVCVCQNESERVLLVVFHDCSCQTIANVNYSLPLTPRKLHHWIVRKYSEPFMLCTFASNCFKSIHTSMRGNVFVYVYALVSFRGGKYTRHQKLCSWKWLGYIIFSGFNSLAIMIILYAFAFRLILNMFKPLIGKSI